MTFQPLNAKELAELRAWLDCHERTVTPITHGREVQLRRLLNEVESIRAYTDSRSNDLSILRCDCGALATCVGRYENDRVLSPACDECCGHGSEDGEYFKITLEDE